MPSCSSRIPDRRGTSFNVPRLSRGPTGGPSRGAAGTGQACSQSFSHLILNLFCEYAAFFACAVLAEGMTTWLHSLCSIISTVACAPSCSGRGFPLS